MKRKFLSRLCILVFSTIFIFACSKHKDDQEPEASTSTISFAKPTEGAIYTYGDSIVIQATAIAKETIHGYSIQVKKANDTMVCFSRHIHDHNDTLAIFQKWKGSEIEVGNMEAVIVVTLDHEGHTSSKKVGFKIQ